jgi:hypothetical protein
VIGFDAMVFKDASGYARQKMMMCVESAFQVIARFQPNKFVDGVSWRHFIARLSKADSILPSEKLVCK